MEKISIAIITKDEERNIRGCLESVKWADGNRGGGQRQHGSHPSDLSGTRGAVFPRGLERVLGPEKTAPLEKGQQ